LQNSILPVLPVEWSRLILNWSFPITISRTRASETCISFK
jgi:hypothetical protein